jgi:hypothetical protein
MASMNARAWRESEILSRAPRSIALEADDGFDFPPTAHPFRELATFSIFVCGLIALVGWGGSKLL